MTDEAEVDPSGFELESYLPFLIVRAAARLEAASDALFVQRFDINRRAWRVLAALTREDGQGVTALAEATATEVSTLSRLIDSMEEQGLVEKRREKPKMRSVQVRLTAGGSALFAAIQPSSMEMGRILTAGLSARDAQTTVKGLRTLYGNIDAAEDFIRGVMAAGDHGAALTGPSTAPATERGTAVRTPEKMVRAPRRARPRRAAGGVSA